MTKKEGEIVEAITHPAFYAGGPSAMLAINKAKTTVLTTPTASSPSTKP